MTIVKEVSMYKHGERWALALPQQIREKLENDGWELGSVFVQYDEEKREVKIISSKKLLEILAEKGNAEREICTETIRMTHDEGEMLEITA